MKPRYFFDADDLLTRSGIAQAVRERMFEIIEYNDPEEFRFTYKLRLRDVHSAKILVHIRDTDVFVPYDIRKRYYNVAIDYATIFPKLDAAELRNYRHRRTFL